MKTRKLMMALAICCGVLLSGGLTRAGDVDMDIQSFEYPGQVTFNAIGTATSYRVEWAPSVDGPWTNFASAAARMDAIPGPGSGIVTCAVPMCYRVIATVTNAAVAPTNGDYLVVDVSGGTGATSYAVSYLASVPVGGWTDEYKTTKIVFRRIPATSPDFTMGGRSTDYPGASDEGLHQVTLTKDFYIGVFEITQKQWERVMGNWPSYFYNATYRDARPVEQVSYNDIRGSSLGANWPATNTVDAGSFMGVLRAKTGKAFDLPTESQWEYACRAGTTTALNSGQNLTNPWGDDPQMNVVGRYWYNGGSGYTQNGDTTVATAKVGSYQANAWGLYDMHGNVWEWCLDWYGTYPGTVTDPKGASSGSNRVFRGGGWYNIAIYCRSAFRNYSFPDDAHGRIGFRAVLPPGQQ